MYAAFCLSFCKWRNTFGLSRKWRNHSNRERFPSLTYPPRVRDVMGEVYIDLMPILRGGPSAVRDNRKYH